MNSHRRRRRTPRCGLAPCRTLTVGEFAVLTVTTREFSPPPALPLPPRPPDELPLHSRPLKGITCGLWMQMCKRIAFRPCNCLIRLHGDLCRLLAGIVEVQMRSCRGNCTPGADDLAAGAKHLLLGRARARIPGPHQPCRLVLQRRKLHLCREIINTITSRQSTR